MRALSETLEKSRKSTVRVLTERSLAATDEALWQWHVLVSEQLGNNTSRWLPSLVLAKSLRSSIQSKSTVKHLYWLLLQSRPRDYFAASWGTREHPIKCFHLRTHPVLDKHLLSQLTFSSLDGKGFQGGVVLFFKNALELESGGFPDGKTSWEVPQTSNSIVSGVCQKDSEHK